MLLEIPGFQYVSQGAILAPFWGLWNGRDTSNAAHRKQAMLWTPLSAFRCVNLLLSIRSSKSCAIVGVCLGHALQCTLQ